ncbi:outer membrane beta-barrel protein [Isoalcanivorax indicus]|uniref:outer membrane beta-barrel protein n=1 Tax=Isoalcanivorax indicus TaxID=2202653 RepID=UPI000DBA3307|nr:outer membrane beta-barrel protein [Isoalcanivorax indicus]
MKKIVCLAAMAMLASPAAMAREGLYGGLMIGIGDTQIEMRDREVGFVDVRVEGLGASGAAAQLFLGSAIPTDSGYWAFELNAGGSNIEYKESYGDELTFESGASVGVSTLLAARFGEAHMYGRLGIQRTTYELTYRELGSGSFSRDDNHVGARLGLGVDLPMPSGIDLRLDWTRTFYNSREYFGDSSSDVSFRPRESIFSVGVVASF